MPFVGGDDILAVRQFRYAAGGFILEVPAGTLQPGEEPEACARREVEEESGHRAGRLVLMASIRTTPGFTDEIIHIYAAYDLTPVAQRLDHDEVLTVERLPLARALDLIRDGGIVDARHLRPDAGATCRATADRRPARLIDRIRARAGLQSMDA